MHTAFAIGTALLKQKWETSSCRQKQLVVSGFCLVWLVWGFFCGGLNSLGLFLPFIVLQCHCSLKKKVFAVKVRTKRKESFVNEINLKSKMCSLVV